MFKVKKCVDDAVIPTRGSENAAGYDLYSNENCVIQPATRKLVSTGISISISNDCYGRVAPRSGLSVKGIDVGAGVIDSDYRGLIKVLLINNSDSEVSINKNDRIAQLILEKIYTPEVEVVDDLDNTDRGENGFGSTGK
jgi:dUTP pyrophosphatase